MSSTTRNSQVTKNTVLLYLRTFFVMILSLIISRIILNALGEIDFGIYNIVAGIVIFFTFLNSAMTSTTQRFISYELGKNNIEGVNKIFNISLVLHFSIAFIVLILSETIGLWFLYSKVNIPSDRFYIAQWVYQISILTCCFQIIRVPYHAIIIAYEKISLFAYLSIIETVFKLISAYIILYFLKEKLLLYSILILITVITTNILYKIISDKNFTECKIKLYKDKELYFSLTSFSGWNLLGGAANMGATQGLNILLNVFFGVTLNAAMGIANQVNSAVYSFVSNFQTAFSSPIIKLYASGDNKQFNLFVFQTSRFSFYLFFLFAFPVFITCENILSLWLGEVPKYAVEFSKLSLIFLLIDSMSGPLWYSAQASGKIKQYQILMATLIGLNVPIIYLAFKMGLSPYWAYIIKIIINFFVHIGRLFFLHKAISFPIKEYITQVMIKCIIICSLALPIPYYFKYYYGHNFNPFILFVFTFLLSFIIIFIVGITNSEKKHIKVIINNRISWKKKLDY